jgi:putative inorganic carbon (HCO3(-)) transporter
MTAMLATLNAPVRRVLSDHLGVALAVIVCAAAIGLAGAYAVTRTSTAVVIVLGLLLGGIFLAIILGRWYLGVFLIFVYAPFEDLFRRVIYFGRQIPHLDPVHLVQEILLLSVVTGILLRDIVNKRHEGRRALSPSPLSIVIGLYFAFLVVQIFNPVNDNILIGAQGFIQIGFYVLFYFVAARAVATPTQLRRLLFATLVCGAIVGLYGMYQHIHGLSPQDQFELHRLATLIGKQSAQTFLYYGTEVRVFSTMGSYTACAAYMCVELIIATYFILRGSLWTRLFALASIVPMALCLIYTYSRTNWLGATAGVVILCALVPRRPFRQKAALLLFLVLLGGALYGIMGQIGQSALATGNPTLQRFSQLTNGQGQYSVGQRIKELGFIVQFVGQNPAGAGVGADLPNTAGSVGSAKLADVHQDTYYALLLFEIGYIGLIAFLGIALAILRTGLIKEEQARDDEVHTLGALLVTIVCVLLLISLGEPYLDMAPIPNYFWLAGGLLASLRAMDTRAIATRAVRHASSAADVVSTEVRVGHVRQVAGERMP